MEQWININDNYQVSDNGNVKSVDRIVVKSNGVNQPWVGKLLTQQTDKQGYLYFMYKRKVHKTHIEVAKAFPEICGEWFDGADVHHLNGVKTDNRAINLVVLSKFDHQSYHNKNGRSELLKNILSKSVIQYTKDGEFVKEFSSIKEAERLTGIPNTNICSCCKGIRKTAGGSVWKYKE